MSSKVVDTLYSKLPKQIGLVAISTTIVDGDLLYEDTSAGTMKPATSSVGTVLNIRGIATQSVTTDGATTSTVRYIPVDRAVYVVANCTNNTAANQLHKTHVMTDAANVNNTSSTVATTLGVFHALGTVGAASAKKLYGFYIAIGQVTA